ncbi:MAG: hypothetical protein KDJ86_00900 [Bauldia sp.]|uniref:hypothetical protein n=1 Tax=Bauldia sp. TaxID=2575872 RepID=UPI001D2FC9DD|nr:hypothetical protein [Bauldia sp.]MCB1494316.1 hypothetical protein [Bauldia sp.]
MIDARLQRRLAIAGAVVFAGLFLAANAHLVKVAFMSQPDCVTPPPGKAPARLSC